MEDDDDDGSSRNTEYVSYWIQLAPYRVLQWQLM
jgi:hypothetical protein